VVPNGFTPPPPSQPEPPVSNEPPLIVPLKDIAQGWPEPMKSEANALNGTTVSIPSAYVSGGLAKGKVAFAWGQLRAWMNPVPSEPSQGDPSLELLLPLKIIAPAFLKHSRQVQQRKSLPMDDSIPELFGTGQAKPPTPAAPDALPEQPEAPATASAIESASVPSQESASQLDHPEQNQPVPAASEPEPVNEVASVTAEEPTIESGPTPGVQEAAATVAIELQPKTLGEAFGQPDRSNWSPSEIVANLVKLPNVAGAAVALQEGLVIAHHLPEPMKGEVFAAFLPQIFARLNQYAGEMKLGAIEDLLVNSSNGPCHVFHRGQVFFAALGKVGEPLPGHVLRLCADALADQ
jgi:predicted regulator of Ras-like GTPase activity (Roadblock/LC7/MglB family)